MPHVPLFCVEMQVFVVPHHPHARSVAHCMQLVCAEHGSSTHAPLEQICVLVHGVLHEPQWSALLRVSTHSCPHVILPGPTHGTMHAPFTQ
jgi:hypothetical protein